MAGKPNPVQLQKYLKHTEYPATKKDLVNSAKGNGATKEILTFLEQIPNREYSGPDAINEETAK